MTRLTGRVWGRGSRAAALGTVLVLVLAGCLTRRPYLTDATGASEVVNFATALTTPTPEVTYGSPPGCTGSTVTATGPTPITVDGHPRSQWRATMTGLTPDTQYCYSISQGSSVLAAPGASTTFRTPPGTSDTDTFSFAVIGDWGAGTTAERNVFKQLAASPAEFMATAGDNAYVFGTQSEYGDLTNSGNVFGTNYLPRIGGGRPVFMTMGNHGFEDFTPQLVNFPQDAVVAASGGRYQGDTYCCIDADPASGTLPSTWYAFDWGPARFYVLEAAWKDLAVASQYEADFQAHWNGDVEGCAICGAERDWLEADLVAHADTELKFAFFHFPLHSDGLHGSDTFLTGPGSVEELLANNGVDVVFTGHDHIYERNNPTVAGSDMVSYVTGGGGQFLYPILSCSSFDAYAIGSGGTSCNAPAPTSNAQVFHFLLVTVDPSTNEVTVTPTDSTGATFDVQTFSFAGGGT